MTTIVIDKLLREKLRDLEHEVEFRDEDGRTVGRFLPEAEYMKLLYERARHLFTDEEIETARQEPGGKPLSEILGRLQKS
ncbi:MAG TPA: hypothetical protein VKU82_16460 [Planctomycetaceae bacterium]|nr:hypothetical protein [Planctomycetaceae bacterium]